MVIDTQALHAYEFAAGVFIAAPPESLFWAGAAQRLTLAATAEVAPDQFLALLRRGDRSFQTLPGEVLAAVNKAGFLVRWLRTTAARIPARLISRGDQSATVPDELGDLAALAHSPKFSQVVIDRRGEPATMTVPDPRALALHKLWLSQQEDREPWKRTRDRLQAAALAELILRYLPQYHFFSAELQWFPAEVSRLPENLVEGYEMAADLETD